jgi:tRNA pseudouridine55 synthase
MNRSNTVSGFLLLDKEPGETSFEALRAVKKSLNSGKVGHTGTLDKFASGLLIILAGKALKLSPWVTHCDKSYEGTIRFGQETETLDPEGNITAEGPIPTREQVEEVLSQFRGNILQAPPAYSAIHVEGRRASELARAGETVEMKKRAVTIYELELSSWDPPLAGITVRCSGGAYIRSLARDIALAAGSRAHLAALRRVSVAGFSVTEALREEGVLPDILKALRPIDHAFFETLGIPRFEAGEEILVPLIHGRPLGPLLAGLELRGPGEPPQAGQRPGQPPQAVERAAAAAGGTAASRAAAIFAGGQFAAMVTRSAAPADALAAPWVYGYVYATRPQEGPRSGSW